MPKFCPCPVCRKKNAPGRRRRVMLVFAALMIASTAWVMYHRGQTETYQLAQRLCVEEIARGERDTPCNHWPR